MHNLSKLELKALLEHTRSERDHLMILTGYYHGLRASEVVGMRGTQVRDGFITVQRLKGSFKTTQPLVHDEDPFWDESVPLESLARLCGKDRVFPLTRYGFYQLFHRAALRAGLAHHVAHPHVLKHTIAMHTIRIIGVENVRQYLGHKSIASTGAYLKVSDHDASLAVSGALKGVK